MGSIPIARSNLSSSLEQASASPEGGVSGECPRNVFTARSGGDDLCNQTARGAESLLLFDVATTSQEGVREPLATSVGHRECQGRSKRPAHPSNRLIAQLNATWRVVDDPLQWILQRRKGNSRAKNTGWRARSYCRTKDALLRFIREHCCLPDDGTLGCIEEYRGMDGAALQQISALPEWHIDLEERLTTAPSGDDPALASDETQR